MKNELERAARQRHRLRLRLAVAETLGNALASQCLSVSDLARRSGLKADWIRKLLAGAVDWDLQQVAQMEAVLKVDLLRVRRISTTPWVPLTFTPSTRP